MLRNQFSLFAPKDTIDTQHSNEQSWFSKLASLLTTHRSEWVTANQAFNLLSAAAAGYILVARPQAITSLTLAEFVTHFAQCVYVNSDNANTQDKLFLLNTLNILYATYYHLAHQQSDLGLAAVMTELIAAHLIGNMWMNAVKFDQAIEKNAEKDSSIPAIARLT